MMIAQGDFLKILNASSDERKLLFQKLFNTSMYEKLQRQLQEMNSAANKEREALDARIRSAAGNIDPENDFEDWALLREYCTDPKYAELLLETLAKLIECEKGKQSEAEQKRDGLEQQINRLTGEIEKAKSINGQFALLEKTVRELDALTARQTQTDDMAQKLQNARRAKDVLPAEQLLLNALKDADEQKKRMQTATGELQQAEQLLPDAQAKLKQAEARIPEADSLQAQALQLEAAIPVLHDLETQQKSLAALQAGFDRLLQESMAADRSYQQIKESYYASQAGLLAAELAAGLPCPVCGSVEHPAPAGLLPDAATKEDLENADTKHRKLSDQLRSAEGKLGECKSKVENARSRLNELEISESETEAAVRAKIADMAVRAKAIRDAVKEQENRCNQLQMKISTVKSALAVYEQAYRELCTTGAGYRAQFKEKLAENGFEDEATYKLAKLPESEIAQLDESIRRYNEEKRSLLDRTAALREQLAGQEKMDIQYLLDGLAAAKTDKNNAAAAERAISSKLVLHENAQQEILEVRRLIKRKEEKWAVIRDLSDCCSGKAGSSRRAKLTFEAYVQQYYFKQVVSAANKRLTVLTDGMFTLRCKEEARDRVHQSGLDLDVLDRSTGQWRDVSTLSGGESFLASLALALGLSDVVQAQSGGVRIDAMFIDEGFGSLDESSIGDALEVLESIRGDSDSFIGIISHVQILRDSIPSKLMVHKGRRTSTIEYTMG
jgi:exonuclease SbcC